MLEAEDQAVIVGQLTEQNKTHLLLAAEAEEIQPLLIMQPWMAPPIRVVVEDVKVKTELLQLQVRVVQEL